MKVRPVKHQLTAQVASDTSPWNGQTTADWHWLYSCFSLLTRWNYLTWWWLKMIVTIWWTLMVPIVTWLILVCAKKEGADTPHMLHLYMQMPVSLNIWKEHVLIPGWKLSNWIYRELRPSINVLDSCKWGFNHSPSWLEEKAGGNPSDFWGVLTGVCRFVE